jgi:hypothetical protein
MNNFRPQFFLVCANNRENEMIRDLNYLGVQWKEVEGCYKGVPERSFLIVGDAEGHVLEFASKYSQESYLFVEADTRVAWLVYHADGRRIRLGRFEECTEAEAKRQDAYTSDPSTKTFYVAGGKK